MSVSVFVQSNRVGLGDPKSCPPCALPALLCKIRLSMPKDCPNPPRSRSTSIFYHEMHYPRRPRKQLIANEYVFPKAFAGEKHPRRARPEPRTTMRTHNCRHPSHAHRCPFFLHPPPHIPSTEPRMNRYPLGPWLSLRRCNDANAHLQCSAARQQARMQDRGCPSFPLPVFACVYTFRGGMWSRAYICVYSSFLAGWVLYWRHSWCLHARLGLVGLLQWIMLDLTIGMCAYYTIGSIANVGRVAMRAVVGGNTIHVMQTHHGDWVDFC